MSSGRDFQSGSPDQASIEKSTIRTKTPETNQQAKENVSSNSFPSQNHNEKRETRESYDSAETLSEGCQTFDNKSEVKDIQNEDSQREESAPDDEFLMESKNSEGLESSMIMVQKTVQQVLVEATGDGEELNLGSQTTGPGNAELKTPQQSSGIDPLRSEYPNEQRQTPSIIEENLFSTFNDVVVVDGSIQVSEMTNDKDFGTDKHHKPIVDNEDGDIQECVKDEEKGGTGEDVDEDEIDMDFVEQFDCAFNEFIVQNTKFLLANPELVHNLRVSKLQAMLQKADEVESDLVEQLETVNESKSRMQNSYQEKLRDASRKKAARDIFLKTRIREIMKETKQMEGTLTWQLISNAETFAKNQFRLTEEFKDAAGLSDGQNLLSFLPSGTTFQAVRKELSPPPASDPDLPLTHKQQAEMRQKQIDNAFLNGEVAILRKKLEYQRAAAQKTGWVESVLVRLDKRNMKKLKKRYKKKVGVKI